MNAVITIRDITRENWRVALALAVAPEQQHFVAASVPIAAIALAKAYIRPGGAVWKPLGLYDRETMIGFAALAYDPVNPNTCWMYHFFIDHRWQGQGYGASALEALLAHIRHLVPACTTVQLTVHPDNTRAQRLYDRAGFRRIEPDIDGEWLYQRSLP